MIHPDSAALIAADAKITFEDNQKGVLYGNPFPFGTPEYDLWAGTYNQCVNDLHEKLYDDKLRRERPEWYGNKPTDEQITESINQSEVIITNEIKPLAGNRVSQLVAYLLQLPQDALVECLCADEQGGWEGGYHASHRPIENAHLYYFEGYGEHPKPFLEIGQKN